MGVWHQNCGYRGGLEPARAGEHLAGYVGDVAAGAVVDGEVLDGRCLCVFSESAKNALKLLHHDATGVLHCVVQAPRWCHSIDNDRLV